MKWEDEWAAFEHTLRDRLDQGVRTYGDVSFKRGWSDLLEELAEEAIDLAGWGFILWCRIQRSLRVIDSAVETLHKPEPD